MGSDLGKVEVFRLEHVLEVSSTPGVVGSKFVSHMVRVDRPADGIGTVRIVCPTCEQHFLLDLRSSAATKARRWKLLASGLAVALLSFGATQVDFLPKFVKALIVAIVGLFIALPLIISGFTAKGHSGWRRLSPEGKLLDDLGGHRLM